MKKTLTLGHISEEKVLRLDHTFPVQAQSNISIQFHGDTIRWISATIYDCQGQLRWQVIDTKETQKYTLSQDVAETSANGIWGDLPAGDWRIEGYLYGEPGQACTIEVTTDEATLPKHAYTPLVDTNLVYDYAVLDGDKRPVSGWAKCDLHTHTRLSDGAMTIEDNQAQAIEMGLDFYVATDHNISPTLWDLSKHLPVVYPGIELTSPLGHFNLLFAKDLVFKDQSLAALETPEAFLGLIQAIKEKNVGIVSINHPFLTVWKWLLVSLPLEWVDAIEIINDPTYKENQAANLETLKFWDVLLNDGHVIPVVGGSDSHLKPDDRYEDSPYPSVIGDPGTYLHVDEIAADQLEAAIIAGHAVVSRFGALEVTFNDWISGDRIQADAMGEAMVINYHYDYKEAMKVRLELVMDGQVIATSDSLTGAWQVEKAAFDGPYHWLRAQVINADQAELLAVTNPLVIGEKSPSFVTWEDALVAFQGESTPR